MLMMMMESQHKKSSYFRKLLASAIQHAQLAVAKCVQSECFILLHPINQHAFEYTHVATVLSYTLELSVF